ncbi:MAG: flagellar protein FlgN [Candidatus Zixiibacteriota bacterium]
MINQLIQIINDEALLFEEFLRLLDCQKEALVANDTERLNQITQLQQQKLVECRALDHRRDQIVAAIKEANTIVGDVTVTRLLEYADEDQSQRLIRLREAVLSLNDRISDARNTNAMLLNRSREFISRTMRMLSRLHAPGKTYGRTGAAAQDGAVVAVDRRI